jgi:hypothetical protein
MRQRVGETDADYRVRRAAYDAGREGRNRADQGATKGFRIRARTKDAEGNVKSVTEVRRGRKPSTAVQIPRAFIERTTTLFDGEKRVGLQWVREKPGDRERFALWQEIAKEFASKVERAAPSPAPVISNMNLLVEYPVGDHHMGMLSWRPETGASYDLDIAETLLSKAFTYLTSVAPASPRAVIEFLGDFLHYDSPIPQTPTSKNSLDADGRHQKMVRYGVRAMRNAVDTCLKRHAELLVIVEDGNHDPYSTSLLVECLRIAYENEPRVTIDTSPSHYHYFTHGKCLVGTHHGHGAKPEALPGIMATDRAVDWGATEYRYWRTGHVHSKRQWDFPGCSVESFRILPPADAWAHQKGYRPHRSMEAIVLHDTFGEAARYPVTPRMLEQL